MLAPSSWVWTRITMPTVQELTVINNSGAWRLRKLTEFSSARHEWMTLCNYGPVAAAKGGAGNAGTLSAGSRLLMMSEGKPFVVRSHGDEGRARISANATTGKSE
jgi:hypothetical protein